MNDSSIITFTSDFGTREYYVSAVKGAILSVHPESRIVDVTHNIASHDLLEAAFTISCTAPYYPTGSIHLVVVDPGVGSSRRVLIASTEKQLFVAPDNGVLSLVYDRLGVERIISVEADHYFRQPVSPTFHGRDIFGPVAGWLARGIQPNKFGPQISDFVRLTLPTVGKNEDRLEGFVLHIDKFGNIVTSLSPRNLQNEFSPEQKATAMIINGQTIQQKVEYYAQGNDESLFFLIGSAGYFEISALKQSAARRIEARRGMKVELIVS